MFQQDAENQSVRYQQKWNDCCGNEKGGAELTRPQSGCIGHIERIQQIETSPDVKTPTRAQFPTYSVVRSRPTKPKSLQQHLRRPRRARTRFGRSADTTPGTRKDN